MATRKKCRRVPWNKSRLVGQKTPLKLREIWAIRVRLQLRGKLRDLALFNLAIDSKLRACDLLSLRITDIAHENKISARAVVMQCKTRRPVQFEITEMSRNAVQAWTQHARLRGSDYIFQAGSAARRTYPLASTPESYIAGCERLAWTVRHMEHTRCAEPRPR